MLLRYSSSRCAIACRLPRSCQLSKSVKMFSTTARTAKRPFRAAIVGSGPAGFYTAARLLDKLDNVTVDMYEQLPTPFGLVRFGVAPDHPEVKNCQDRFEDVAALPKFNFIGNVEIGKDIHLSELKNNYDSIILAYGASKDKVLGVPGESLDGVHSARAFVGWYNGLPEFEGLDPNLESGDSAVVIGQGNVALDVARILLTDYNKLRATDIAQPALDKLRRSRIRKVDIVGRRGAPQASFTIKELRELVNLPAVGFAGMHPPNQYPDDLSPLQRPRKRIADLLKRTPIDATSDKAWSLRFMLSPQAFIAKSGGESVCEAIFSRNVYSNVTGPPQQDIEMNARVEGANPEKKVSLPASLVFRSIGYKAEPIPGLAQVGISFDVGRGVLPNHLGRIIDPQTNSTLPGLYCAGWVKRGPTGVIASTMEDAFITAECIIQDVENRAAFLNGSLEDGPRESCDGWNTVRSSTKDRSLRPVLWEDWQKIDRAEKAAGSRAGKPREKILRTQDMLRILD